MRLPNGGLATVNEWDMEEFLKSRVALYQELAPGVALKKVATPFLSEDHRDSPARAPSGTGLVVVCTWSTSFVLTLIFVPDIEITLICAGQKRNQSKARCSDRSEQNEACRIICID